LNLSRLPKLPKGTPPLISRRSTPGDLELGISWNRKWRAVDGTFAQAVRLEFVAEQEREQKTRKKLSQKVTRFPSVQTPSLDIRMVPKKVLLAKEQKEPPILSKNTRKRSDLSLLTVIPKATVHRFAVVRGTVRRRIVNALDLIIRRGAAPFPESEPQQRKPEAKNNKLGSEGPKILLHNPTLADPQIWVLPDWTYVVFPSAKVFTMPLPDLVEQMRLALQQANQKARVWQDRYVSPETGEFIPHLSKGTAKPEPRKCKESSSRRPRGEKSGTISETIEASLGTSWGAQDARMGSYGPQNPR